MPTFSRARQITNYSLVKNTSGTPVSVIQQGKEKVRGGRALTAPQIQTPGAQAAPGSSRWLCLSSSLCLPLSLSRCDGVFTLDILLLNKAVLHIHCSIITNTDFACKPDPFCPLCVHLSDRQIFRLKEVTEDST